MTTAKTEAKGLRFPIFQGPLPIEPSQVPTEIIAGITLAALAIPEVMGYTKIAATPVGKDAFFATGDDLLTANHKRKKQ